MLSCMWPPRLRSWSLIGFTVALLCGMNTFIYIYICIYSLSIIIDYLLLNNIRLYWGIIYHIIQYNIIAYHISILYFFHILHPCSAPLHGPTFSWPQPDSPLPWARKQQRSRHHRCSRSKSQRSPWKLGPTAMGGHGRSWYSNDMYINGLDEGKIYRKP